ncbi:MAG: hypothetical protein R3297_11115, partial [Desulfobulbales bacterium]|nr:hypothetical protein [Desulfobulbales bacterium]
SLGADVPFFIAELPAAWATGIGDRLQKAIPLAGYSILIVNPGYSVSTPWVYENFALTVGQNINNLQNLHDSECVIGRHDFSEKTIQPEEVMNDLEKVTISHYPEIDLLKKRLIQWGASAALMSGSGPTVFGMFKTDKAEEAAACAQDLKRKYPSTYLVEPLQS